MSHAVNFECPHCRQIVELDESSLGRPVDCPHCDQQFEARLPAGRVVEQNDTRTKGKTVAHGNQTNQEETLKQVHPVVFRSHLLLTTISGLLVIAGLVGLVMAVSGSEAIFLSGSVLMIVSAVGLAAAVLIILGIWIQAIAVTLIVTSERTIVRRGILSRSTNEVQHDDIRNIHCDQNIVERMLDYGDVALSSSGQDDMEIVVKDVPNPQSVIEIIRRYQ